MIDWLINLIVQTFQQYIIIYRRGNFVYLFFGYLWSYPFRSLAVPNATLFFPFISYPNPLPLSIQMQNYGVIWIWSGFLQHKTFSPVAGSKVGLVQAISGHCCPSAYWKYTGKYFDLEEINFILCVLFTYILYTITFSTLKMR